MRSFTTDGYYVVREDRRGAVDTRAGVRFVSGVTRLDYLGAKDRFFVKLDILAEERANGTVSDARTRRDWVRSPGTIPDVHG